MSALKWIRIGILTGVVKTIENQCVFDNGISYSGGLIYFLLENYFAKTR